MSWVPVGMIWRNHVPDGFHQSDLKMSFPVLTTNSSPGTSKVGILTDPIQGRNEVRMTVREPYLKGRSNGKSANALYSWSSRVRSKRGKCQFHTMVTGTRDGKKFMWRRRSSKATMNFSGTSGFFPFASLLSLNEQRISYLVQKDQNDRFTYRRPWSRSWSEKENVGGIPTGLRLSGNHKSGSSVFVISNHFKPFQFFRKSGDFFFWTI